MPSPFPGMDPFLEEPQLWPDVHARLIVAIGDALAPAVAPAYIVRVEQRTYIRVRESYLEIVAARTHQVVTTLELLSPINKHPGEGRREYEAKRQHVLLTLTHLVEIDLLRGGEPFAMTPRPASDYRVLVSREWDRPQAALYPFNLPDPLPAVPVPLRPGEPEPSLSLGALLAGVYERARYDLSLDYQSAPPAPPLPPETTAWLDQLLRDKAVRC